jgi:hypothetical protein
VQKIKNNFAILHVTKCDQDRCRETISNVLYIIIISHKTIILLVVLYGWETLYMTLRDEHRVFENLMQKIEER